MSKKTISIGEVSIRFNDGQDDDLIGWASCVVNDAVYLNNILVKKGRTGLYLHFPRVASKPHFVFNPITSEALAAFEDAISIAVAEGKDAINDVQSG
jgi:DNA-binding cell septation regulator SpoVG